MKKIFLVFVLGISVILTGCSWQKKSSATVTDSSKVSDAAAEATVAATDKATDTSLTDAFVDTSSGDSTFNLDFESQKITSLFDQAYQEAYSDANATLKGKAKFCNSLAEFTPAQSPDSAKLYFFFTSDDQTDWYWIGQKDLLENKKIRLFAAKRDFTDIACTSVTTDQLTANYADALKTVVDSKKATFAAGEPSKIKIYIEGYTWKVEFWKSDSTITSQTAPITATTATTDTTTTK
jgi:hypothetical protein